MWGWGTLQKKRPLQSAQFIDLRVRVLRERYDPRKKDESPGTLTANSRRKLRLNKRNR
jgi:hypothetical protein